MSELISKLGNGEIIGFTAVVGAMLCGIFAIVGGILLKIRKESVGASLKQNMLDRGMSAEDIKTVMEAGTEKGKKCG